MNRWQAGSFACACNLLTPVPPGSGKQLPYTAYRRVGYAKLQAMRWMYLLRQTL
jgi:hypothetical protein